MLKLFATRESTAGEAVKKYLEERGVEYKWIEVVDPPMGKDQALVMFEDGTFLVGFTESLMQALRSGSFADGCWIGG